MKKSKYEKADNMLSIMKEVAAGENRMIITATQHKQSRISLPTKHFFLLQKKLKKYEEALASIACFHEGKEVNGSFDSPSSAGKARKALGKVVCGKYLRGRKRS